MAYLEKNKVRSLFNGLLKQLIVQKPANPLDFMMEKLAAPMGKLKIIFDRLTVRRYILVGKSQDRKMYA